MAKKTDMFEFDAPKYFDFTKDDLEEPDNSYFDPDRMSSEGKKPAPKSPQDTRATENADEATQQEDTIMETEQPHESSVEPQEQTTHSQELVKSPTAAATQDMSTENAEEPPQTLPDTLEQGQSPASSVKRRRSHKLSGVGVRQSQRLFNISKALRRSSASRRSLGDIHATTTAISAARARPQKRMVRKVCGVSAITQEDKKEVEAVAVFRDKITHNKKKKAASTSNQPLKTTKPQEFQFATDQRLRKPQVEEPVPAPAVPVIRHTHTGPTKPREFTFATDARLKTKEHVKGMEVEAPVEFARSLRSSTTSLNKEPATGKGATIPQPFNLSESRKPQAEEPKKFVSMAELNYKYYIKTPTRLKSKRAGSTEDLSDSKKPRETTLAHTPNLATSRRRRSLSVMTHEEREQQAFEEAQKNAFKARPVNRKVLQTPPSGYRVEKKLPTVPEPFNVTATKKYQAPLLPECLTDSICSANVSVSSLPHGGLPLQSKRPATKMQPFSFDSRDKQMMVKKQEKIKKVVEEEMSQAEFHARPMPIFEDGVHGVPSKRPPTPTQVKPFALQVDRRGSIKQEKFKQQLEEENMADVMRRKFHAQSDDVVHKKPFIPDKSQKPLTELSNLSLNTEVRASQRCEYDQNRKIVEEDMLAAKKMEEERQAADELAEVTRLRKEAVHKAQPVHKFKPVIVQPAPQPPTVPVSPDFATKSRLASRANSTLTL